MASFLSPLSKGFGPAFVIPPAVNPLSLSRTEKLNSLGLVTLRDLTGW